MKRPSFSRTFERDVKRCQKRGYDLARFKEVVPLLLTGATLPPRCRLHRLSGDYENTWECHLAPDWLLVFSETSEAVTFLRMGTHADLF